jgi:hypothetical protein
MVLRVGEPDGSSNGAEGVGVEVTDGGSIPGKANEKGG